MRWFLPRMLNPHLDWSGCCREKSKTSACPAAFVGWQAAACCLMTVPEAVAGCPRVCGGSRHLLQPLKSRQSQGPPRERQEEESHPCQQAQDSGASTASSLLLPCVISTPLASAYLFCLPDAEELGCNDCSQLSTRRNAETSWEAQLWGDPPPSVSDFMA